MKAVGKRTEALVCHHEGCNQVVMPCDAAIGAREFGHYEL